MQENHNATWNRYLQFFSCRIAILNWQEISWYGVNHKKLSSNSKCDSNCCNVSLPVNPRKTLINLLDFFTSISAHWHMLILVFREWKLLWRRSCSYLQGKYETLYISLGIFSMNIYVYLAHWFRVTHMRQWTRPSAIQIMLWRRSGAKPLSETAL